MLIIHILAVLPLAASEWVVTSHDDMMTVTVGPAGGVTRVQVNEVAYRVSGVSRIENTVSGAPVVLSAEGEVNVTKRVCMVSDPKLCCTVTDVWTAGNTTVDWETHVAGMHPFPAGCHTHLHIR